MSSNDIKGPFMIVESIREGVKEERLCKGEEIDETEEEGNKDNQDLTVHKFTKYKLSEVEPVDMTGTMVREKIIIVINILPSL